MRLRPYLRPQPSPVRENTIAHLGRRGLCKRDGNNLAGIVDLAEQAEKAAREQIGLAGAGRRAHQDGTRGVERMLALWLVGRWSSLRSGIGLASASLFSSSACGGFSWIRHSA